MTAIASPEIATQFSADTEWSTTAEREACSLRLAQYIIENSLTNPDNTEVLYRQNMEVTESLRATADKPLVAESKKEAGTVVAKRRKELADCTDEALSLFRASNAAVAVEILKRDPKEFLDGKLGSVEELEISASALADARAEARRKLDGDSLKVHNVRVAAATLYKS